MSAARLDARGSRLQPGGDGRRGIVDFDHRVGERVFEHAVHRRRRGCDEVRNSSSVSDSPERFGGHSLDVQAGRISAPPRAAAAPPHHARGRPNRSRPAAHSRHDRRARREPPPAPAAPSMRVSAHTALRRASAERDVLTTSASAGTAARARLPELLKRSALHGRPLIVEELRHGGGRHRVPCETCGRVGRQASTAPFRRTR